MKKQASSLSVVMAIFFALLLKIELVHAANYEIDRDVEAQVAQLTERNMRLQSELTTLITDESLVGSAQPFPEQLRLRVDSLIVGLFAHSDRLIDLSQHLATKHGQANCANALNNDARPGLSQARLDYTETRQAGPHDNDRDLQLANLLGYQMLAAASFTKNLHAVRQALIVCSHPE